MRASLTLAGIMSLSGCAYLQPTMDPVDHTLPDAPMDWVEEEQTVDIPPSGDWLAGFNDPALTTLVDEALENNPSLSVSLLNVKLSRASAADVFGTSLPQVNASTNAGWSSSVADVNDSPFRNESPSFGLSLSASWEPDFWGRIDAQIASAEATLAATEFDLQTAQLSVAANAAIAWFQLKDAVRQEALALENLTARERTQTLTERRFRNGLTGALDVRLARSSVESAKASLLQRKQASGEARRALEVLLGRYPSNELDVSLAPVELAPLSGAGDPTSLLSRRPDIKAAEARIMAAGFDIYAARMALRPALSLSSTLSSNNDDLIDVLDPSYWAANLISSITAPIYAGGRLKANVEIIETRAEITAAQYVSATLTAWQEVENAIAADALLEEQVLSQARALEEAELAEGLAEREYQSGVSTIFNLIDAQTRRINSEASLISAQTARTVNRVRFHLALGGDLPADPEFASVSDEDLSQ